MRKNLINANREMEGFWELTIGSKSRLNLAGKIFGFPFAVMTFVIVWTMTFLFEKSTQ